MTKIQNGVLDILQKATGTFIPKFRPKDVLQVIIGSTLLAVPVGFTEEVWTLSDQLPLRNVAGLMIVSLCFVATFTYYSYYRRRLRRHFFTFIKRVGATYLLSFSVVAGLLTLIQITPWSTDWLLAIKRVILVTFPSSMSAVVADTIK